MGYKKARIYTINIQPKAIAAPADSTDYYFGQTNNTPGTSATYDDIYIGKPGILYTALIDSKVNIGAIGTNEDWSLYIRHNDTTDYLIATIGAATQRRTWLNSNLNIPLDVGDTIIVKCVTPAWVDNPTGLQFTGTIFIRGILS
jgi:hypothetical protein